MERIQIYKIINPYLLKIINTNYIDRDITIDIIDFFYYLYNYNNDYNYINNKIINQILNLFKLKKYYLEYSIIDNNDILKDNNKLLTENEQIKVNKKINEYSNELNRIINIYNYFKNNYDYNIERKYKNTHLSDKIKIKKNLIKSYCNIEEFIKPMKKIF